MWFCVCRATAGLKNKHKHHQQRLCEAKKAKQSWGAERAEALGWSCTALQPSTHQGLNFKPASPCLQRELDKPGSVLHPGQLHWEPWEQHSEQQSDLQTALKLVNCKPTQKKTNKNHSKTPFLLYFPSGKKNRVKNKIYKRSAHKNTQQHLEMLVFCIFFLQTLEKNLIKPWGFCQWSLFKSTHA